MKNLKYFETAAEQTAFTENYEYLAYCKETDEVNINYETIPQFFCKLTLDDDTTVEIDGEGELTQAMISAYFATCVCAELGELCTSYSNLFYNFEKLSKLILHTTDISQGVFYQQFGLTELVLCDNVSTIGNAAFFNCADLLKITCEAITPPTLGGDVVFDATNNCPIYVPSESVDAYKTATYWSEYADRIQAITE